MTKEEFMQRAITLSKESVDNNGGPFGAVVVKNGEIVSFGSNSVTITNDPTAHAEVSAIREACYRLGTFDLDGCEIYSSCEPCPMCLGAIYWSGIKKIYYAGTREDAKKSGFDDSFIYDQICLDPAQRSVPAENLMRDQAVEAFTMWDCKEDKTEY